MVEGKERSLLAVDFSLSPYLTLPAGAKAMEDRHLPSSRTAVHVNTAGAMIVNEVDGGGLRDSRDIYLPKHTEWISHIAVDIGGSLAKVVYFSRAPHTVSHSNGHKGKAREAAGSNGLGDGHHDTRFMANGAASTARTPSRPTSPFLDVNGNTPTPNGVLGPASLASATGVHTYFAQSSRPHPLARTRRINSSVTPIPGGWLNFTKFETGDMDSCIEFITQLIESSSASHHIPSAEFKARHVKIMATGGGAHLFHQRLSEELGVEVRKEEEMECLIEGLTFFMEIPHEVFRYSDELVDHSYGPHTRPTATLPRTDPLSIDDLPRPSPNPPEYSLVFNDIATPQFPCMLVNIGSGVSVIKVDEYGKYERISGTSLGGGTLWGLLSLLTGAESFDGKRKTPYCIILIPFFSPEMLALSEQGDNSTVDMLVGDICKLLQVCLTYD